MDRVQTQQAINEGLRKQLEDSWNIEDEHKKRDERSKSKSKERQEKDEEQIRRITVTNIRRDLDALHIHQYFAQFGAVQKVVVSRQRYTGPPLPNAAASSSRHKAPPQLYESTGNAYVTFKEHGTVEELIKISELQMEAGKIRRRANTLQGCPIGDGELGEIRFFKSRPPNNRLYLEAQEGISLDAIGLRIGNIISPPPKAQFSQWWRLPAPDEKVKIDISLVRRLLQLKFTISSRRYCLSIKFSTIRGHVLMFRPPEAQIGVPTLAMMFTLSVPPHIFCKDVHGTQHVDDADMMAGIRPAFKWVHPEGAEADDDWHRTTDPTDNQCNAMGTCMSYRLTIEAPKGNEQQLKRMLSHLMEYGFIDSKSSRLGPQEVQLPNPSHLPPEFSRLTFEIRWRLSCMLCKFTLYPEVLQGPQGVDFLARLRAHSSASGQGHAQVIALLDKMLTRDYPPFYDPMEALRENEGMLADATIGSEMVPDYCAKVPRVLITPTRVVLLPPEMEMSNRVLRHYHKEKGRFLRVSVVDENRDTMRLMEDHSINIKARIKSMMHGKLPLCSRQFEFLAFSNSSLRENSFWMVAPLPPPSPFNATSIRAWMGDFTGIKNVAKYCARMGQCFSSSISTISIPMAGGDSDSDSDPDPFSDSDDAHLDDPLHVKSERAVPPLSKVAGGDRKARRKRRVGQGVEGGEGHDPDDPLAMPPKVVMPSYEVIDDYKTADGQYMFSDGVGLISCELALRMKGALEEMGVCPELSVPSAFQIRFRGVKGMVVKWPNLGVGLRLVVRESMHKFKGKEKGESPVEVLDWSRFRAGTLNHQAIILLSTLGVPDDAFIALQDAMVEELNKLVSDADKARELVPSLGQLDTGIASTIKVMLEAGISVQEPFLQAMLQVVRMAALRDIQMRARLQVHRSAYLFGVMDETGVLEYGECFCCVQGPSSIDPVVIEGDVAVTKMPCLHPGDVRRLRAVRHPGLQHIVNCIVFPMKGPRPHPSECAGSDLDGDQYLVIWEPTLLPPRTVEPFAYPAPAPKNVPEVTIPDVIDFFVAHMQNDNLGQIANAHKCWFEEAAVEGRRLPPSQWGACSRECLELANMHHQAVDFGKTGRAAPSLSSKGLTPKWYPHYMNKPDKRMFNSESVLGQLYDRIHLPPDPLAAAAAASHPLCDDLLLRPDSPHFYPEVPLALATRLNYENDLMKLMKRYNARGEAELLTGCIIEPSKFHRRMKDFQLHQQVMEVVRTLQSTYLQRFATEQLPAGLGRWEGKEAFLLDRASAWYYVTYHPQYHEHPDTARRVRLYSFPWMAGEYLRRVRVENLQRRPARAGRPVLDASAAL